MSTAAKWQSKHHRAWGNSKIGINALGQSVVDQMNENTPEHDKLIEKKNNSNITKPITGKSINFFKGWNK